MSIRVTTKMMEIRDNLLLATRLGYGIDDAHAASRQMTWLIEQAFQQGVASVRVSRDEETEKTDG